MNGDDTNGTPPPAGVFSVLALAVTMVGMLYSCDGHRKSEENVRRMERMERDVQEIKASQQERAAQPGRK